MIDIERRYKSVLRRTLHHGRTAFTLVEVVAVIVVLGILAGVAVPKFLEAGNRARMTSYIAHANIMTTSLYQYEVDFAVVNQTMVYSISQSTYSLTPIDAYLDSSVWNAFGGAWNYVYYGFDCECTGFGTSELSASKLPGFGSFPAAGQEFMQLAAAESGTISAQTSSPPYSDRVTSTDTAWKCYYYTPNSGYVSTSEGTVTLFHSWNH